MSLYETQKQLAEGIRKLRKERRLTQQELAKILDLSQAHLSKIEHGQGSITAEQLISLLQKYSLPLNYFVPQKKTSDIYADLQNALIHLGASHLQEVPNVSIPERLIQPEKAIVRTLVTTPTARLVTALVPVIVKNYETININRIVEQLRLRGFENRFWWIVEGTYHALAQRLDDPYLPRALHRQYQRAFLFLERKKVDASSIQDQTTQDELDRDLLSARTIQLVKKNRDKLAKRWHIITRIKKTDLAKVLKDSEEI